MSNDELLRLAATIPIHGQDVVNEIERLQAENEQLRLDAERIVLVRERAGEWRAMANMSRMEANRIRSAIKAQTGAEERCMVRAHVWESCACDIDAALEGK